MAIIALFLGSICGFGTAGAVALTGAPLGSVLSAYIVGGFATSALFIGHALWSRGGDFDI